MARLQGLGPALGRAIAAVRPPSRPARSRAASGCTPASFGRATCCSSAAPSFNSTATEENIIHEGIYLGENWVIHSSDQGVYVLPLKGSWLGDQFAWGRK